MPKTTHRQSWEREREGMKQKWDHFWHLLANTVCVVSPLFCKWLVICTVSTVYVSIETSKRQSVHRNKCAYKQSQAFFFYFIPGANTILASQILGHAAHSHSRPPSSNHRIEQIQAKLLERRNERRKKNSETIFAHVTHSNWSDVSVAWRWRRRRRRRRRRWLHQLRHLFRCSLEMAKTD